MQSRTIEQMVGPGIVRHLFEVTSQHHGSDLFKALGFSPPHARDINVVAEKARGGPSVLGRL
jgi:hypothetical protein